MGVTKLYQRQYKMKERGSHFKQRGINSKMNGVDFDLGTHSNFTPEM